MATVKAYTPTPSIEFSSGITRPSMGAGHGGPAAGGTGLLGRLNSSSTLYRQSAPTHGNLAGSPGIPESGLKDYNRVGVNFFGQGSANGGYGRGAGNGTNGFTGQARSAASNDNKVAGVVGKPNNRGFMCGKKLNYSLDNTDYGSGNPKTAADASFYRQNMNTDKYGETVKFANSRAVNNSASTRNGAYAGGQNGATAGGA